MSELLQPPEPTIDEMRAYEAHMNRQGAEYTRALLSVQAGDEPAFWCDVRESIYGAVQDCLADETLSPVECWARVVAAVGREAHAYAEACAWDVD